VLAFPCNRFGSQEPHSREGIIDFVKSYGVTFPIFDKVFVNGAYTEPFYRWLKVLRPGPLGTKGIPWNFTKFLLSREGLPVHRYISSTAPLEIIQDLEALL